MRQQQQQQDMDRAMDQAERYIRRYEREHAPQPSLGVLLRALGRDLRRLWAWYWR